MLPRINRENAMTRNNSIHVIAPYWYEDTWVFDDDSVGLVREPFVAGMPEMINHLVRDISNARDGFRLTFSDRPFPGHTISLEWLRAEDGGNWYQLHGEPSMEGWLCPALYEYFKSAPRFFYMKADRIGG